MSAAALLEIYLGLLPPRSETSTIALEPLTFTVIQPICGSSVIIRLRTGSRRQRRPEAAPGNAAVRQRPEHLPLRQRPAAADVYLPDEERGGREQQRDDDADISSHTRRTIKARFSLPPVFSSTLSLHALHAAARSAVSSFSCTDTRIVYSFTHSSPPQDDGAERAGVQHGLGKRAADLGARRTADGRIFSSYHFTPTPRFAAFRSQEARFTLSPQSAALPLRLIAAWPVQTRPAPGRAREYAWVFDQRASARRDSQLCRPQKARPPAAPACRPAQGRMSPSFSAPPPPVPV